MLKETGYMIIGVFIGVFVCQNFDKKKKKKK